jgi:hypothetical protein
MNIPQAQKSFWAQMMQILGNLGQMEARVGFLEIVLISTQDSCTVCAERAIGLEIILGQPMERLGDVGQVKDLSGQLGGGVKLGVR